MNALLFCENRQKLCLVVEIWDFLVADTFTNERFFFAQILCYFAENRRNSQLIVKIWTFFRTDIFFIFFFFFHKYSYFAENRQNWELIVKIWTFLVATFQMKIFACVNHGRIIINGLSISAKREIQSRCSMIGKTMSLRCHFLVANCRRLIDWIQKKIKPNT